MYEVKADGCKGPLYVEIPQTITSSFTIGEVNLAPGTKTCYDKTTYYYQNIFTHPRFQIVEGFPPCSYLVVKATPAYEIDSVPVEINPTVSFNSTYDPITTQLNGKTVNVGINFKDTINYTFNNTTTIPTEPSPITPLPLIVNNTVLAVINGYPAIAFSYKNTVQYTQSNEQSGVVSWSTPIIVDTGFFRVTSMVHDICQTCVPPIPIATMSYIDETNNKVKLASGTIGQNFRWEVSSFTVSGTDSSIVNLLGYIILLYLTPDDILKAVPLGTATVFPEIQIDTNSSLPHTSTVNNTLVLTYFKGGFVMFQQLTFDLIRGLRPISRYALDSGTLNSISGLNVAYVNNQEVFFRSTNNVRPSSESDWNPPILIYSSLFVSGLFLSDTNIVITGETGQNVIVTRGAIDGEWQGAKVYSNFNPGTVSSTNVLDIPAISYLDLGTNLLNYGLLGTPFRLTAKAYN